MMRSLSLTFFIALTACNFFPDNEKKEPAAPAVHVDLPPLVKLEGTIPPAAYPDKTMRIDGLLARKDQYLDKKLKVRGYLVEIYQPPEGATQVERPHIWLADTPAGGDKRLMIVNLPQDIEKKMEVGKVYDITGHFQTTSDTGFVLSTGLLVFEKVDGIEPGAKDKKRR